MDLLVWKGSRGPQEVRILTGEAALHLRSFWLLVGEQIGDRQGRRVERLRQWASLIGRGLAW